MARLIVLAFVIVAAIFAIEHFNIKLNLSPFAFPSPKTDMLTGRDAHIPQ